MGKVEDDIDIKEKIKFSYGANNWETYGNNIFEKEILTDGPHGVRLQEKSTNYDYINLSKCEKSLAYPSLSMLANSFDQSLLTKVGYQIGCEANKLGVSTILAPGINIIRHPRCGRAFEYFSEDPLVSGLLGAAYVKGVEKSGAKACVKHFCCNNQETKRMIQNSCIDDRTLHELYIKPFEIALKAKPSSVMVSYNAVNGTYMCENKALLDELRNNTNYKGIFISDWGAVSDSVKALNAGLNLEMPATDKFRNEFVYNKYLDGLISKDVIENNYKYVTNFLSKDKVKDEFIESDAQNVCLKACEESIVLLKNQDDILPLSKQDHILIIGAFFKEMRFGGSGSSEVNPSILKTPYVSFNESKVKYDYIEGFDNLGHITNLENAKLKALDYDKILIFTGLPKQYESEGFDRDTLSLPQDYITAINEISKINKNTIVIINAGSVTSVPYLKNIKGLIYFGLPGSFGGDAIYNILYGKVCPCGKLAQTYVSETQTYLSKKYPIKDLNNKYSEGLYVGYPYYYLKGIKPIFEFGYGLSYSKFKYSVFDLDDSIDIEIESSKNCKNTLFMFVEDNNKYIRLKDFKSIKVFSNKVSKISFEINDDLFKFYNDGSYKLGTGKFYVLIGSSLNNIIYKKEINIKSSVQYVHPEIDIKLSNGLLKKSKVYSYKSTIEDFKGTPYYDYLVQRLIKSDNADDDNLMIVEQKKHAIEDNMLHFYTLFMDLNFSINELDQLICKINSKKSI